MISAGKTIARVYNTRFEAVFGTRGFNPCLDHTEEQGAKAALLFV